MKFNIALYALVVTLGAAASASAQDDSDVAYQKTLLARALSAEDKAFCDGLVGTDAAALEACHITRLFVIDINAGKDGKRFPPKARPKYAKDSTEKSQITDRM